MEAKRLIILFLWFFILLGLLSQGKGEQYIECQARDNFLDFCERVNLGSSSFLPYCCPQVLNIQDDCLLGLSQTQQYFIKDAIQFCNNSNCTNVPTPVTPPYSKPRPQPHKICESVTQLLETCGRSNFLLSKQAPGYCCMQVGKITKHCYVELLDPMEHKLLLVAKNICENHHAPPLPPPPSPSPSPPPPPPPTHRTRPATCSIDTVLYDSCNPQKPYISDASINVSQEEKEFMPQTTSTGVMTDEAGCCVGFAIFTNDCTPAIKDLSYAKINIYNRLEAACSY